MDAMRIAALALTFEGISTVMLGTEGHALNWSGDYPSVGVDSHVLNWSGDYPSVGMDGHVLSWLGDCHSSVGLCESISCKGWQWIPVDPCTHIGHF
jgi:hypothetical protein